MHAADNGETTTINIINAISTNYEKNPDTGNDSIVLEGAVELSVTKGSTKTTVKANKVSYDRKTKMLFAEGSVQVTSTGSGSGDENIQADTLILNTSTLEGVFDNGRVIQTQSDAINLPSGSTLVVFSDLFGKSESNTLAFKNASLTFCDDDDPHWKINASRIWLLPGGEFAFLNGILYVGAVPVLYLPAFYYPKDELIFNPTFGYKFREGFFIQTSTYLYGRKPLGSTSVSSSSSSDSDTEKVDETLDSLYNFMKPSKLKQQKLEGIVLHNLDEDYTGNTSQYLKLAADWYSNLGFMVGLDGNFSPKNKAINTLSFAVDVGFSNPIFQNGKSYSSIGSAGQKYWDKSHFFGLDLPFRFKTDFQISISKPFSIKLSMPIYSYPFFSSDFGNRNENLNWITVIKDLLDKDETVSSNTYSSYTWSLSASYAFKLPDFIKPYVSSLSMNASSSINISSITADKTKLLEMFAERYDKSTSDNDVKALASVSPERSFFYPSQIIPVSGSATLSGTIFQWPPANKSKAKTSKAEPLAVSLIVPSDLQNESEKINKIQEEENETNASQNEVTETENKEIPEVEKTLFEEIVSLPDISSSVSKIKLASGFKYSLGYSASPNISTQIGYSSTGLAQASDFDFSKMRSSMYTFKMPVSLNSNMSYGDSFIQVKNSVSFSPVWQDHNYVLKSDGSNGGYSDKEIESLKKTDLSASSKTLTNSNTVSFQPFVYSSFFNESGISWNTNLKLYQKKYLTNSNIDNPLWDEVWIDFDDKETVTTNELRLVLATNELNKKFKQTLTVAATLPPLDEKYTFQLGLVFPYVTFNVGTGFHKTSTKDITEWNKDPLQQSLSLSIPLLGKNLSFSESFSFNLDDETPHADSLRTSLSWYGVSLSYAMNYAIKYDFVEGKGWVSDKTKDKQFLPYSLSVSYSSPSATFYKWKNRISISPGLSTSLVFDLVRTTNSYFQFSPSLTFRLNGLFDVKFSATSRNSSIVTYFDDRILGQRKNIFIDLINSFRFDDESLRKSSGFKLKSLNIDMSHELHDWKFKFAFKIEPKLVTRYDNGKTKKAYIFDPYIAVGITWSPMETIKSSVEKKYDSSVEDAGGIGYYVWSLD